MTSQRSLISLTIMVAIAMSGCGMTRASHRAPTPVAVVHPTPPEKLAPKKGSIWQTSARNSLFEDNKARYVGDIIRVHIKEKSDAKKAANSDSTRSNSYDISALDKFLTKNVDVLRNNLPANLNSLKTGDTFSGGGKVARNSTFEAFISCTVTEVLSNGNLRIEGRRDITLNNENEFIILSGLVRPVDIDTGNTVESSDIADARIEYSGDGLLDDQQRPSWLNQFLTSINIM